VTEVRPSELTWADVDPARHPFDPAGVLAVVTELASPVPVLPADRYAGAPEAAAWRDAVSRGLVERYGRWAAGWCWATGEGDWDGGPGDGWCCVAHSVTTPGPTLSLIAGSLIQWRAWLEDLAARFERLADWEAATAELVVVTAERTGSDSAWFHHCRQVLAWFLTAAGVPPERHADLVEHAVGGRFRSWVEPPEEVTAEVARRLAEAVRATGSGARPAAAAPQDALSAWLRVRADVDWASAAADVTGPLRGARDGVRDYYQRRPFRPVVPVGVLDRVLLDAAAGGPLTVALLARWQADVLYQDEVAFRTGTAVAKGGRERYHFHPGLPADFDRCLAQAGEAGVPLPARAARAYLDVAFHHPFDDGNARAAGLALYYVLAREGVVLQWAAPVLAAARPAHDAAAAVSLARLVERLMRPPLRSGRTSFP
jgi:hypothetical protein